MVSAYTFWEVAQSEQEQLWAYTDASAHRLVSDIAALIDSEHDHRVLVAGDFNVLYGYGDDGSAYWNARSASVFQRFEALGLTFVGPRAPEGGRQPDPWPAELPRDSRNVVTCHSGTQTPASGTRQLDYVFASRAIADRVRVKALNGVNEWGPSDHCRVQIDLDEN